MPLTDNTEVPEFSKGGTELWNAIVGKYDIDAAQAVQLAEACRLKDRLDRLNGLLTGEVGDWTTLRYSEMEHAHVLKVDSIYDKALSGANTMKMLLAALRLPDEKTGKRPQERSAARGAYGTQLPQGSNVSALNRARARKTG